ncbi:shikimate kinase AroK [Congregibacter sp.]|uniref:shikimate kinase AroK n=1 Tax=Congregibacter sp. TaxID=2744308 RepID=UPI003F6B3680
MSNFNRVFLVGPMGAGKTTIGKLLARGLKLGFADSDSEIENRTGADIAWIFDVEGEEGFRNREESVIEEMTLLDHTVLATGGGVVMREANRRVLASRGFVIYLHATLNEQIRRTRGDRSRPLLNGNDPETTLRELFELRDPLYRDIADYVIDTDSSSPKVIAQRLLAQLP